MTTQEGDQYTKMFSSLPGVRLIFQLSLYLNILCICSKKRYYTEHTN